MIQGLDLSSVQGLIDPSRLDPSVEFVYLRCGVGNDGADVDFWRNAVAIAATGRAVGAYHFLYPLPVIPGKETRDPCSQARSHANASKLWGNQPGQLPPAMDLEWPEPSDWAKWGVTADSIKASALAYLVESERLHGRAPVIYDYPDFERHLGDMSAFARYSRWKAAYGYRPSGAFDIWQTTGGGGKLYSGAPVDTDIIVDDATFNRLANRPQTYETKPNGQTPE